MPSFVNCSCPGNCVHWVNYYFIGKKVINVLLLYTSAGTPPSCSLLAHDNPKSRNPQQQQGMDGGKQGINLLASRCVLDRHFPKSAAARQGRSFRLGNGRVYVIVLQRWGVRKAIAKVGDLLRLPLCKIDGRNLAGGTFVKLLCIKLKKGFQN